MRKHGAKAPSQRQLRVGEALRHVLAETFEKGEIRDPGLGSTSITVSEVRVGPDLKRAVVYVAPLGGGETSGILQALERARPFLRRQVAQHLHLKFVPDLMFRSDTTFDDAARIDDLLRHSDAPGLREDPSEDPAGSGSGGIGGGERKEQE